MPLDPDIAMLITEIEANLSHAESITHGLTREQFRWRPAERRWSIGECLAHMNLSNGPSLPVIEAAIASGRAGGKTGEGPFRYGFISRKFIAGQEPPVKKKHTAPRVFQPPREVDLEATVGEYRRVSNALKRLTREASGLDLRRVKVKLPALPSVLRAAVRMPLGARITLITAHDRRHLWQAEGVRNEAGFP